MFLWCFCFLQWSRKLCFGNKVEIAQWRWNIYKMMLALLVFNVIISNAWTKFLDARFWAESHALRFPDFPAQMCFVMKDLINRFFTLWSSVLSFPEQKNVICYLNSPCFCLSFTPSVNLITPWSIQSAAFLDLNKPSLVFWIWFLTTTPPTCVFSVSKMAKRN